MCNIYKEEAKDTIVDSQKKITEDGEKSEITIEILSGEYTLEAGEVCISFERDEEADGFVGIGIVN